MSLQGEGNRYRERKGQEISPDGDSRKPTRDTTGFYLTNVLDSNTTLGNQESEKLAIGGHNDFDLAPAMKDNQLFFEKKGNNESASPWPFAFALAPSVLQSLTTPPGEQSKNSISTITQNEPSTREDSSRVCRTPEQSSSASQTQNDNIRLPSQNTKYEGLHPLLFKNLEDVSGPRLWRLQSAPGPTTQVARGLGVRSRSSRRHALEEKSDEGSVSPVPNALNSVGYLENDDGRVNQALNTVVFSRGVSVDVPGTPLNSKRRYRRKMSYQLPPLDEKAEILFFQEQFRNPSSVIVTGKWEIPVHGSIILLQSPLLAQKLKRSRRNAAYLLKGLNDSASPAPAHRKRHSRILKSGNQVREIPVNYFRIEKPPRAVFEFLKLFYPQCELDLYTLSTWSEVMAISELCREYDVAGGAKVIEKCKEYMKVIMKDLNLEELMSLDLRSGFCVEFQEQIAGFIVGKLITGQISAKEMEKFNVEKWKQIMSSKAWRSGRSNADYGQLVICTLEWIALNDSHVSKKELLYFLDCISGYPGNVEAIDCFIRAIKSDVVDPVVSITKRFRLPLQIEFWRRISDYIFRLSDLGFVPS